MQSNEISDQLRKYSDTSRRRHISCARHPTNTHTRQDPPSPSIPPLLRVPYRTRRSKYAKPVVPVQGITTRLVMSPEQQMPRHSETQLARPCHLSATCLVSVLPCHLQLSEVQHSERSHLLGRTRTQQSWPEPIVFRLEKGSGSSRFVPHCSSYPTPARPVHAPTLSRSLAHHRPIVKYCRHFPIRLDLPNSC